MKVNQPYPWALESTTPTVLTDRTEEVNCVPAEVGREFGWFTDATKRMSHIETMTSAYSAALGPHLDLVLLGTDKMVFLQLFQKTAGQQLLVSAS